MYAEYYNLKTMPFQLTPDSQFFFESKQHERAIAHLIYGMAQDEGFILITGEIGAGKTMLIERLWSQLDLQKFKAVRILTTQLSGEDLLKMVGNGFGLPFASDKAGSLQRLEQLFAETRAAGKRCLLVVDEVQNLPISALEELRMLSNITVGGQAPFQCLLLGQPQFREMLSDSRLEQLKQRVLASYHLGPLSGLETRDYVQHRLRTAGWSGDPSFEEAAFAAIYTHSGGIPRKINTVCSRILLAGFI
jgi:putative secretion ATPase (PEP-CTERM system associated)